MTRSRRLLPVAGLAALLALSPMLAPLAEADGWAPEGYRYDTKAGSSYVVSTGSVTRQSGYAHITGSGGMVEYQHAVNAGTVAPDGLRVLVETYGSGSCRYQVFLGAGGQVYDSGFGGCSRNGDIWTQWLPVGGVYTVRITCQGSCDVGVWRSQSLSSWLLLSVWVSSVYSGGDVSDLRIGVPPGTCAYLRMQSTHTHSTIVEIDWGDGTPVDARPIGAGPNLGMEVCHSYPPSTVPYQACFRLRETNGLARVTTNECKDLPFMLPTV